MQIGGLTLAELNALELHLISAIDFDLGVRPADYAACAADLRAFAAAKSVPADAHLPATMVPSHLESAAEAQRPARQLLPWLRASRRAALRRSQRPARIPHSTAPRAATRIPRGRRRRRRTRRRARARMRQKLHYRSGWLLRRRWRKRLSAAIWARARPGPPWPDPAAADHAQGS